MQQPTALTQDKLSSVKESTPSVISDQYSSPETQSAPHYPLSSTEVSLVYFHGVGGSEQRDRLNSTPFLSPSSHVTIASHAYS